MKGMFRYLFRIWQIKKGIIMYEVYFIIEIVIIKFKYYLINLNKLTIFIFEFKIFINILLNFFYI